MARAAFFYVSMDILPDVLGLPPGTTITKIEQRDVQDIKQVRIEVHSPNLRESRVDIRIPEVNPLWRQDDRGVPYFLGWYSPDQVTDKGVVEALTEHLKEMEARFGKLEPVMDYFSPQFERAKLEVEAHLISHGLEPRLYVKQTWPFETQCLCTEVVRKRVRFNQLMDERLQAAEELKDG